MIAKKWGLVGVTFLVVVIGGQGSKVKGGDGGQVGGGLSLKVLRKHIKRLVNYAEAGDGDKIREELKRIVPEYKPDKR